MAITRPPREPLPKNYVPTTGTPYKVKNRDTWKTLAQEWSLDVNDLILHNFKTLNSAEVNWYLYRNVGCRNETPDGFNYVFSSADRPGIIYRPPPRPPSPKLVITNTFDDFNERVGSGTDLAKALREADKKGALYDYIGFALNVSEFATTAIAISAVELGALGISIEVAAPIMSIVALGLTLGGPHYSAINDRKNDKALNGLSQGIVLGAAGESNAFVTDHFVRGSEDYNTVYPEQRKNFQAAYLWGLVKGLKYGDKLTKGERLLFFKHLDGLVGRTPRGEFYMQRQSKNPGTRRDYYIDCAAKFRNESTKRAKK